MVTKKVCRMVGLLGGVLLSGSVFGAPVESAIAKEVAWGFAKTQSTLLPGITGVSEAQAFADVWVVPLQPEGYVIVERDDTLAPITAFGERDFPTDQSALKILRAMYTRPVVLPEGARHADWEGLLAKGLESGISLAYVPNMPTDLAVNRILAYIYWNQVMPYNLYAPGVTLASSSVTSSAFYSRISIYGTRAPVGCTATAESQIAYFFRWPYRLRHVVGHNQAEQSGVFRSFQVAAPGEPYRWTLLQGAEANIIRQEQESTTGSEAARLIQHWATGSKMSYQKDLESGAYLFEVNDVLKSAFGYQPFETVTASTSTVAERLSTIRRAIVEEGAPVLMEIELTIGPHAVACVGWAEQTEGVISGSNCYLRLNYGWADGGTWYRATSATTDTYGVTIKGAYVRLPMKCGDVTAASAEGTGTKVTWYEAPYWRNTKGETERTFVRQAIGSALVTRTVDLEALAATHEAWFVDETGLNRTKVVRTTSTVRSEESFKGGTAVKLSLVRASIPETYPGEDSPAYWAEYGCSFWIRLISLDTGAEIQSGKIALLDSEKEGTYTLDVTVPQTSTWKIELYTGYTSYYDYACAPYYVTKIEVENTQGTSEERVTFALTDADQPDPATGLYTKVLPDFAPLAEGEAANCALLIGDGTEGLWTRVAEQSTPQVTWHVGKDFAYGRRFWLTAPEMPISLTITDADETETPKVTAYLSNALWLDPNALTSEDGLGFPVTPEKTDEGTWQCVFTLPANPDTSVEDRLSFDSEAAVGRDVVLALKVEDSQGNTTWTHSRMTFAGPDVALSEESGTSRGDPGIPSAVTVDNQIQSLRRGYNNLPFREVMESYAQAGRMRYTEGEFKAMLNSSTSSNVLRPEPEVVIHQAPGSDGAGKATFGFKVRDGYAAESTLFHRFKDDGFRVYGGTSLSNLQELTPTINAAEDGGGTATLEVPQDAKSFFFKVQLK